ncbi:hypothetical protein IV203_029640 [Nitzschia inconspicua]|uniref:Uncharacterized protein n=1 Tax=Nitzschia inconspicua TaxID=303405 RepID=A0A9K3Q1F2_9STRA|nr:hypothetical protein IV203_029640 [Nitzschia inconspicua]
MVLLSVIPEFSTMCMQALDAFESINTCKGAMFDSLNCNEAAWSNDSRDEGVEMEAEFGRGSRLCAELEDAPLRQAEEGQSKPREPVLDTIDTMSVSSSINPALVQSTDYKQRRHVKLDSFTTFLPYDDDDIFRSRHASQGSDSKCFRLCKLDRCTAFSQDSTGEAASPSPIHPLKRDLPASRENPEVRLVHWDELVEDPVVNIRILA